MPSDQFHQLITNWDGITKHVVTFKYKIHANIVPCLGSNYWYTSKHYAEQNHIKFDWKHISFLGTKLFINTHVNANIAQHRGAITNGIQVMTTDNECNSLPAQF